MHIWYAVFNIGRDVGVAEMRVFTIGALPSAIIGDWESWAPAWSDLGSDGVTLYSALIYWLILNELAFLAIFEAQSHQ